jgi:hypothetical protein
MPVAEEVVGSHWYPPACRLAVLKLSIDPVGWISTEADVKRVAGRKDRPQHDPLCSTVSCNTALRYADMRLVYTVGGGEDCVLSNKA